MYSHIFRTYQIYLNKVSHLLDFKLAPETIESIKSRSLSSYCTHLWIFNIVIYELEKAFSLMTNSRDAKWTKLS